MTGYGQPSFRRTKALWAALAASAMLLGACGEGREGATSEERAQLAEARNEADVAAVYKLQSDFHRATTSKDLELMMSTWAEDAILRVGDKNYTGKEAIRTFVTTQLGAFKPENQWVALTHSPKIQIALQGDQGTLNFQCHYADAATKELASMQSAETKVIREGDKWLFKEFVAAPGSLG